MDSNPSEASGHGHDLGSSNPPIETLTENKMETDGIEVLGVDVVNGSQADESRVWSQDGDGNRENEEFVDGGSMEKGVSVVGLGGVKKDGSFVDVATKGDKESDDLGSVRKSGLGGDQRVQVEEQEQLRKGEKTDAIKNDQRARYKFLIQEDKIGFSVDDLVWGKVKSHPWWPGQIFDPKYASEMALKRPKKDHFLVAYFGDKSFAWVPESQLKPFPEYFLEMEKQSSMEPFVNAVDSILEEVSRRVELGMACHCLEDEIYANLKYKKVENAGIREGSCSAGVDRSMFVNAFQPEAALEYIHVLAQCPYGGFDRLELTIATAQLKAFYRSKGYPELPVFVYADGLVDNDAEIPLANSKVIGKGKPDSSTPPASIIKSGKKPRGRPPKSHVLEDDNEQKSLSKQKEEEDVHHLASSALVASSIKSGKRPRGRPRKNIHIAEDDNEQKILSKQKEEEDNQLACSVPVASSIKSGKRPRCRPRKYDIYEDDSEQKSPFKEMEDEEEDSLVDDGKSGSKVKSVARASRKKFKVVDSESYDLGRSTKERLGRVVGSETEAPSSTRSRSLRVGDRIRRGASQLKESPMIVQSNDGTLQTSVAKRNRRKGADRSSNVADETEIAAEDYSSPSEMLSQLCLIATGPMNEYSFLSMIIGFFTAFRASLSSSSSEDQESEKSMGRKRGRKKKVANSESAASEMSEPDYMQDSYWSDIVLQSSPEREAVSRGRKRKGTSKKGRKKKSKPAGGPLLSTPVDPSLDTDHGLLVGVSYPNEKQEVKGERIISNIMETNKEETPTALILSFNESDAVPSAADLIKIFCPYGPLREEETEVLRKTSRAKVVFKYRPDAEKAFSSAGKYSVFGPALVSYRLRYSPSPKSSPAASSQDKNDASPTNDGNLEVQAQEGTEVTIYNT